MPGPNMPVAGMFPFFPDPSKHGFAPKTVGWAVPNFLLTGRTLARITWT